MFYIESCIHINKNKAWNEDIIFKTASIGLFLGETSFVFMNLVFFNHLIYYLCGMWKSFSFIFPL